MTALEPILEREDEAPVSLRLPAAAGMPRGALVLHTPPRRRVDERASDILAYGEISDAKISEFFAELRALGGMSVIA